MNNFNFLDGQYGAQQAALFVEAEGQAVEAEGQAVEAKGQAVEAEGQAVEAQVPQPAPAEFHCIYCNEVFGRAYTLRMHMNIHQNKYTCEHCGRNFTRARSLVNHQFVHTNQKLYTCTHPGCGRMYQHDSSRRAHERDAHGGN